ncbi:MAG: hypothetical protein IID34_10715 [Planctomycetes bacterium]|nr:hypothetical protein [Planctomycetota bacterium]
MGLSASGALSKGQASFLIDRALQYEAVFATPATNKQKWFLCQRRAWCDNMSKREATKLIGELKARQAVA